MDEKLFHYRAKVVDVYDGDTCRMDIDLGLGTWKHWEAVRIHRINAPEMRGADKDKGTLSRDFLRSLILDKEVYLQTIKDSKGKYGRYLGEIWLEQDGVYINVNDKMVETGHAEYHDY